MKDTNDVYAENITRIQEPGYLGVAYDLKGKQEYNVHVDIPGDFTVYNSLAAISLCRHMGIVKEDVLSALNTIQVKGRLEIIICIFHSISFNRTCMVFDDSFYIIIISINDSLLTLLE